LFTAQLSKPVHVALYSGGLDSFLGAFQHLSNGSDSSFVLVSGCTNTRQRVSQREQVRAIGKFSEHAINHVIVPFGLQRSGSEQREEKSQRSRGFLFLSLGAATAISAGVREVKLYENGIGAINLPFDGTQLGTFNSRAVHPVSLLHMERFLSLLIDGPFRIHNPFLFCTKTEMCDHLRLDDVGQIIRKTFSCDSFPLHVKDKPQCGSCTSCLLRRMSLESAGLSRFDPSEGYLRDLLSPTYAGHAKGLRGLRAMEWQARRLGLALAASHPLKSLSQEFPELHRILSELSMHVPADSVRLQEQLLRLYSRYVSEWNQFSARKHLNICSQAA
jgi:7-cyano-7-deazaguanine synthase in queuosine biosynthesis